MDVHEAAAVWGAGAVGYGALELLWRGRTHWSMLVTGGLCFLLMYIIANFSALAFWKQLLMSAAVVTTLEFVCGVIVNLRMNWNVWDYSGIPGNLLGQICPAFSLCWLLLAVPLLPLCRVMRRLFL